MKTIAFFDTKSYDRESFIKYSGEDFNFRFFENKLNPDTVSMAACCDAVCAFVNDDIDRYVLEQLEKFGVGLVAMRCAGYNNVDLKAARGRVKVVRVPAYSPYAVAEHAMGMILMLNRKLHRAYIRTRDHNFSLEGLTGFDLKDKTVGIIGTGKIGRCFADICKGFGMNIIGFDPYESEEFCGKYMSLDELLSKSDIISLHCPLTKENRRLINKETVAKMKDGVFIINTSRGRLIDTQSLVDGLKSGKVAAAGLDVYEEETDIFFEDYSDEIIKDDTLSTLISMPNVIVTSHQAFLTREALSAIAETTVKNLEDYFSGKELTNEIII
ncbi:MAG: 2-hydroxyacid dehydrogenase [Acutalibacteraceae bacterium]|nr:2-hydroxyacid dehydrogenase [Acutalibacteraceae bacterium]